MAINWQEEQRRIKEEGKKRVNTTYDSAADVINKNRDSLIAQAGAQRDTTLATQKQEYQGLHDQAAAQEIVNRRRTGEAMANAGLTDSGLNRTQQTAITLARGNQDAALTRQQQDARDAINLAYDEMVLQAQNEAAQQLTANEKERNEYLAAVEEMYGENIAAGIAAEAEAKAAEQKLEYENQLKLQQMAMDFYLDQVKESVDPASAAATTKAYTGVDVGGLSGGEGAEEAATPYSQQTYKKVEDTPNGFLGLGSAWNYITGGAEDTSTSWGKVDWNDKVSVGGKTLTLSQVEEELMKEGMSKKEARQILLELTNLADAGTYTAGATVSTVATDIKSNVDTLKLKVKNGQMSEEDMLDTLAYGTYANDESKLRQALAYMGYSTPQIEAIILEAKR